MKKRTLALASVAVLIASVAASWPLNTLFTMPSTAHVPFAQVNIYVDGELWSNGSLLDWGVTDCGSTYWCNLTVQNTGDKNCTVCMTSDLDEAGWTLTWTKNETILEPFESAIGDLDLTVPVDAEPGTYSWNTYILAEQT